MPGMDGYQVCAELKRDPRFAETPILFISARSDSADRIKGLELGAVDYIGWPFHAREVVARIRTQLKISSLTRDLRIVNSQLLLRRRQLEEDLNAAREIQASLLPRSKAIAEPWVKVDWCFTPCGSVGGDVFNIFWLDREHLGVYIVDVSGHGLSAAMVTVAVSRSLSADSGYSVDRSHDGESRIASPGEVMRRLDAEYPMERFGKFLTVAYMVLNCRTHLLQFSCAGHPPPLLVHPDGTTHSLTEGGAVIGLGVGSVRRGRNSTETGRPAVSLHRRSGRSGGSQRRSLRPRPHVQGAFRSARGKPARGLRTSDRSTKFFRGGRAANRRHHPVRIGTTTSDGGVTAK